jgi:hypothetical protein
MVQVMSADDIFDAAVAIAREVVDDRYSTGAKLRRLMTNHGIRIRDFDACDHAASEFAAPYLQRIAGLELQLRIMTNGGNALAELADKWRDRAKESDERIAKLESENKALRDAAQNAEDDAQGKPW